MGFCLEILPTKITLNSWFWVEARLNNEILEPAWRQSGFFEGKFLSKEVSLKWRFVVKHFEGAFYLEESESIEYSSFNIFNHAVDTEIRLTSWYGSFTPLFTGIHTSQVVVWDFWTINSRTVVKLGMVGWTNHQVVAMLVMNKGSFWQNMPTWPMTPTFLTQLSNYIRMYRF